MHLISILTLKNRAMMPISPFKIGPVGDLGNGLKIISRPFNPGVSGQWVNLTKPN